MYSSKVSKNHLYSLGLLWKVAWINDYRDAFLEFYLYTVRVIFSICLSFSSICIWWALRTLDKEPTQSKFIFFLEISKQFNLFMDF